MEGEGGSQEAAENSEYSQGSQSAENNAATASVGVAQNGSLEQQLGAEHAEFEPPSKNKQMSASIHRLEVPYIGKSDSEKLSEVRKALAEISATADSVHKKI